MSMPFRTAKRSKNVYFECRKRAEKYDPRLKSREKTAEILNVSAVSLRDYETGITRVVPAEVVAKMATIYGAPQLRLHYCAECPIGEAQAIEKPSDNTLDLDRLTLKLLSSFKDISYVKETLIEIAADGIIEEDEKPQLEYVLDTLDVVANHVQELKMWAERELGVKF